MHRLTTSVFQIALVVLCPFIELGHGCALCSEQTECRKLECDHDHVHEDTHDHDAGAVPHECPNESEQCYSCICDGALLVASSATKSPCESACFERLPLDSKQYLLGTDSRRIDGSSAAFYRLSGWEIRALIESLTL